MPWPQDDLSTADLDSGTDTPPRAEFLKLFERVKALIAGRGQADGVASLDARRRVPDAEMGRGVAGGVAGLDGTGRVPDAQLPERPEPVLWRPGDLKVHCGTTVEDGWLRADGGAASRTDDAALFAAIGTAFGAGDGATTFNLPDYTDAFILGASATRPVGTAGGAETHRLTVNELPRFTPRARSDDEQGSASHILRRGGGSGAVTGNPFETIGGDRAHNNMPPFVAAMVLIKR